jgi:hypothetical protein
MLEGFFLHIEHFLKHFSQFKISKWGQRSFSSLLSILRYNDMHLLQDELLEKHLNFFLQKFKLHLGQVSVQEMHKRLLQYIQIFLAFSSLHKLHLFT